MDTNMISELRRREPEPGVVQWFEQRPAGQLYLSVLSLGGDPAWGGGVGGRTQTAGLTQLAGDGTAGLLCGKGAAD